MWAEIVALHGRYSTALAHLNDESWTHDAHTEMLCALASGAESSTTPAWTRARSSTSTAS
jgi:hypothetical protein